MLSTVTPKKTRNCPKCALPSKPAALGPGIQRLSSLCLPWVRTYRFSWSLPDPDPVLGHAFLTHESHRLSSDQASSECVISVLLCKSYPFAKGLISLLLSMKVRSSMEAQRVFPLLSPSWAQSTVQRWPSVLLINTSVQIDAFYSAVA